ncbi:MAG: hypothetical protein M3Q48_00645 [Actinomycetota bacterium]|nr:hypothetical protein [Actinomycetota bacterium]
MPETTEQDTDGVEGQCGGEEPDDRLGDNEERRDLDAFDEDENEEKDREAEQWHRSHGECHVLHELGDAGTGGRVVEPRAERRHPNTNASSTPGTSRRTSAS